MNMLNVSELQQRVEEDGILFLVYGRWLSQAIISGITQGLEKDAEEFHVKMGPANNLFTIFIELSQNMMNYSKNKLGNGNEPTSEGLIAVSRTDEVGYVVHSYNVINIADRDSIEGKLSYINGLDRSEIKKKYRELRRSGAGTHSKGGGIGFYEIAKRCDSIEYEFHPINENRVYFYLKATIEFNKNEVKNG